MSGCQQLIITAFSPGRTGALSSVPDLRPVLAVPWQEGFKSSAASASTSTGFLAQATQGCLALSLLNASSLAHTQAQFFLDRGNKCSRLVGGFATDLRDSGGRF